MIPSKQLMGVAAWTLLALGGTACADGDDIAVGEGAFTASSTTRDAPDAVHVEGGCEMFVERVGLASASHRALTLSVELKVNAALLDGATIDEIGFRGFKGSVHHPSLDPTRDQPNALKKIGPDSWEFKAIVFHDRANEKDTARTGRFYVKAK